MVIFLIKLICRIQPVYVADVAGAIVSALKDDGTSTGKVYELGGPEVFTIHELVNYLLHLCSCCIDLIFIFFIVITETSTLQAELMYHTIREWPRYLKVPFPIAKVSAYTVNILESLEVNLSTLPFSCHDELTLVLLL